MLLVQPALLGLPSGVAVEFVISLAGREASRGCPSYMGKLFCGFIYYLLFPVSSLFFSLIPVSVSSASQPEVFN